MSEIVQVTTNRGRYYKYDGDFYKSVTTILGAVDPKPWLTPWKIKMVAQYAYDNLDVIRTLKERGEATAALNMLKGAADYVRDAAGDRGTLVHEAAEDIANGKPVNPGDYDEAVAGYIQSFIDFTEDHKPEFTHLEVTVASKRGMYAGTMDIRANIKGYPVTLDTKTSKNVGDDMVLQLAAYNHAEFVILDGVETEWAPTEHAAILQLKPTGYKLHKVNAGILEHEAFLAACELYYWQLGDHT